MGPQVVEQPHELREREPERAAVAGGIGPMTAAFGGEADAHAEQWFDAEGGGAFHDQGQFIGHFEDDDDLQAHFAGAEGEVDELTIFVAIADDEGLGVVHVGQGGEEFRFTAGLEAVLELASEAGYFADDLVLLIDLDGVDAAVLATIILFSDGASERDIEFLDARVQDVAEAEQQRHLQIGVGFFQVAHQAGDADAGDVAAFLWFQIGADLTGVIDGKVTGAPAVDTVEVAGFLDGPRCFLGRGRAGRSGVGGGVGDVGRLRGEHGGDPVRVDGR